MSEYGPYTNEREATEAFRDEVNEVHELVTILGYDYDAGTALERLDPIAFREEFNNWLDAEVQQWEDEHSDDEEEFEVPEGDAVLDSEGTLWVREGDGDRWTQENMPPSVPRVTAALLTPWGPFTKP